MQWQEQERLSLFGSTTTIEVDSRHSQHRAQCIQTWFELRWISWMPLVLPKMDRISHNDRPSCTGCWNTTFRKSYLELRKYRKNYDSIPSHCFWDWILWSFVSFQFRFIVRYMMTTLPSMYIVVFLISIQSRACQKLLWHDHLASCIALLA